MTPQFHALDTAWVTAIRNGGADANGLSAERAVSDGSGNPCRHCLRDLPKAAGMLILALRPFPDLQPYAETGPIFLCAEPCARWEGRGVPPVLSTRPDYLLKGYDARHRIVYGTGQRVAADRITACCREVFSDTRVTYIHVRSASNTCYQARVTRGDPDDSRP